MELTLRETCVETAAPRMRVTSALQEAAEAAVSPRKRDTSLLRNAQEPTMTRKKARRARREGADTSAPRVRSPVPWFDCERYGPDIWTEVAKHLSDSDLLRLSQSSVWLRRLLTDDSIWRQTLMRDLGLPAAANIRTACPPGCTWKQPYRATLSGPHAFLPSNKELCGWRVGGFVLDAPEVLLTGTLPLPPTRPTNDVREAIRTRGACVLTNARIGLWVADMQVTRCSGCTFRKCKGTIQVLDARHSDAILEENLEYEKLGDYMVDQEVASAFCGIVSSQHITSPLIATVLNLKSWIAERNIFKPRTCISTHAVAVNSNLQRNKGLLTMFLAARDSSKDGQIVSVRMVQFVS